MTASQADGATSLTTPSALAIIVVGHVIILAAVGFGRFGYTLILPDMQAGLGATAADMGLIASANFFGYFAASFSAGPIATLLGLRKVMGLGMLVIAAGLVLTSFATSVATAAAAQVLVGAATAAPNVAAFSLAASWFDRSVAGRANGLVVGGAGTGTVLAGLILPPVIGAADEGWRLAWVVCGLLCAVAAIAGFLVPRPPRSTGASPGANLMTVYRMPSVWLAASVIGCFGVVYVVYSTFFGALLTVELGYSLETAGVLWGLAGLLSVASGFIGGALSDRIGRRQALVVLFLVQAVGPALFALGGILPWWLVLVSVFCYGITTRGFPAVVGVLVTEYTGRRMAPAAVGVMSIFFGLGLAIGPILAGTLIEGTRSFTPAYLAAVAIGLLGALISVTLRHPPPAEP